MEQVATIFSQVSPVTWALIAATGPALAATSLVPHARKRWHECRLARRLARDPLIPREELAEFNWKIDLELAPVEWGDWSRKIAGGTALFAGALIAADLQFDLAWEGLLLAFAGLSMLYQFWRRLNDPPDLESVQEQLPPAEYPTEALIGFAFAIVLVTFLVIGLIVWV